MPNHSSNWPVLFAQSTKYGQPTKTATQNPTTPQAAEDFAARVYFGWTGAVLLLIAIVCYARWRWARVRPKVAALPEGSAGRIKPGHLKENLDPTRWDRAFTSAIKRAETSLSADPSPIAVRAAAALRAAGPHREALAKTTREAALAATRTGELQSRLVSADRTTTYTLVFPDKHAHDRLIRRYPALADGWLAHAARIRRGLTTNGQTPELLCLLFFLGPDARDGTLAVAYEADDGRLAAAELVGGDPSDDPVDGRPLLRTDGWNFGGNDE